MQTIYELELHVIDGTFLREGAPVRRRRLGLFVWPHEAILWLRGYIDGQRDVDSETVLYYTLDQMKLGAVPYALTSAVFDPHGAVLGEIDHRLDETPYAGDTNQRFRVGDPVAVIRGSTLQIGLVKATSFTPEEISASTHPVDTWDGSAYLVVYDSDWDHDHVRGPYLIPAPREAVPPGTWSRLP